MLYIYNMYCIMYIIIIICIYNGACRGPRVAWPHVHACVHVCMYVYVCMYVCMYVGMYVCMHVCMYGRSLYCCCYKLDTSMGPWEIICLPGQKGPPIQDDSNRCAQNPTIIGVLNVAQHQWIQWLPKRQMHNWSLVNVSQRPLVQTWMETICDS